MLQLVYKKYSPVFPVFPRLKMQSPTGANCRGHGHNLLYSPQGPVTGFLGLKINKQHTEEKHN